MAVRREVVKLELEDNFSREVIKAAGATKLLQSNLDSLSGTSVQTSRTTAQVEKEIADVGKTTQQTTKRTKEYTLAMAVAEERARRLRSSLRDQAREMLDVEAGIGSAATEVDNLNDSSRRATPSIDRLSGRLGIMLKAFAAVGPGIIPVGAVGAAGLAGLANQFGFVTVAAGTAMVAFQGVGTALEAVNKLGLDPTQKNLEEARKAMEQLDPAARALVGQLQDMRPLFDSFTSTAAGAMFPGLIDGLRSLERIGPQVNNVLDAVGSTLGDLFAAAGDDLASGRWDDFFQMLATEARPTLTDLGSAIGSVVHGLSEMWEATAGLNRSFGSWLADAARDFDRWATGLKETEGFQNFVEYVTTNGPKVADLVGSVANAIIQIAQAAAPLGGPVLSALSGIADALATIADSPIGTPLFAAAGAISAISLAANVATASVGRLNAALLTVGVRSPLMAGGAAAGGASAAASSGPIGAAIAAISVGVIGLLNDIEKLKTGEIGAGEGLLRSLVPALRTMDLFGVSTDGVGEKAVELGSTFKSQFGTSEGVARSLVPAFRALDVLGFKTGEAKDEAEDLAEAQDVVAGATKRVTRAINGAPTALRLVRQEMLEFKNAVRESASAFLNFSDAIAGDTFNLDRYLKALEKQVAALAKWRDNIEILRNRGLAGGVIDELIRQGPAAAQAVDALANGGRRAIDRMNDAFRDGRRELRGVGDDAADAKRKLDDLGGHPTNPEIGADTKEFDGKAERVKRSLREITGHPTNPTIGANTDPFDRESNRAKGMLHDLDMTTALPEIRVNSNAQSVAAETSGYLNGIADEEVWINVRRRNLGDQGIGPDRNNDGGVADGGTIMGPRQPYGDKVWRFLAPGEEVISNRHGQADRHRALLKAINASRGETVSTHVSRQMAAARPMGSGSGGQVVRHVFEHRVVVSGRMDARQAVAEFRAEMHKVSTDVAKGEINAHENWKSNQSGGAW